MRNHINLETVIGGIAVVGMAAFMFSGVAGSFWSVLDIQHAFAGTSTSTNQTINLTVNQVITLFLSTTTLTLPSLTPGIPVSGNASATVTTNADQGFQLLFNRVNNPTSTLTYGATSTFPDATNTWNPTLFGGVGNATDTTRTVVQSDLSFRVASSGTTGSLLNTSYWGSVDTDGVGQAEYAGFPTTSQVVASTSTYTGVSQIITYKVRADAPLTQRSGTYSGQITITATAQP